MSSLWKADPAENLETHVTPMLGRGQWDRKRRAKTFSPSKVPFIVVLLRTRHTLNHKLI